MDASSDYALPHTHKKRKTSVAPRVSVHETRTGASVVANDAAPAESGATSSEPVDLTSDERTEDEALTITDAARTLSSAIDSDMDDGDHSADEERAGETWKHSGDGRDGDKRRSRKRVRPRESDDPLHMRVVDLRSELRRRGLKTTGNKPALLNRLLDAMEAGDKKTGDSYDYGAALDHLAGESEETEAHAQATTDAEADRRGEDSTIAPRKTTQTVAEREVAADLDAGDEDDRVSKFSTAEADLQAASGRKISTSLDQAAPKTRPPKSISSETGLKITPTSSASSFHDGFQPNESLPSDTHRDSKDGDESSTLAIQSNEVDSVQVEAHTTPRDQIVPSSYASHPDMNDGPHSEGTKNQEGEDGVQRDALADVVEDAEAAPSEPPVPGSVSWLHSRAKEAFKAFTERRIDTPGSTTSLLARGFRALQDAIVPDSAADTSYAPSEQLSQSASKVPNTSAPADPDSTPRPNLRATTSLPATDRLPTHKVTFASNDVVDTITEEPRTDDSTIEDGSAVFATGFISASETDSFAEGRARSASLPKAELSQNGVHTLAKTPDSSQSSSASGHMLAEKAKSAEADRSDEARRKREFEESVDREVQRLRMAAKLSAQKRIEEAKATKTYWEQREQLKLKMQMQSSPSMPEVDGADTEKSTPATAEDGVPSDASAPNDEPAKTRVTTPSVSASTSVDTRMESTSTSFSTRTVTTSTAAPPKSTASLTRPRADSMSSTVSSVSSSSSSAKGTAPTSTSANGTKRALPNLVSGVHSFTTLIDNNKAPSSASTTRSAPVVNSLKLAEKTRQQEKKKEEERLKRKQALAKKYEEQRKLDEKKKEEDKKKREAEKENAERDAKQKRELERIEAKKKREQELAHKRHERLQAVKMRSAKLAADKEKEKARALANMIMKAPAPSSSSHASSSAQLVPPPRPTKPRPAKVDHSSASNPKPKPSAHSTASAPAPSSTATSTSSTAANKQPAADKHTEVTAASYDMSDQGDSDSDGISTDENDDDAKRKRRRRDAKNIPEWAQRENLDKTLRAQFGPNAIDPSPSIFPDFADTCDLEAIFDSSDARRKKRFGRRTSSGNWFGDRPTARDRALYRRDMGFNR